MAAIELELKDEAIKRYFQAFGKSVAQDMRKALAQTGMRFEDRFVRKRMSRHGKGSLGTRTGQLKKALARKVTGAAIDDTQLRVAFALPDDKKMLPWVHEEGATIKPRTAKWLTIPLKDAKTKSGVLRGTARQYIDGQVSTPKIDGTFFRKSASGNLLLFGTRKLKTKTKLIPLFVLKKQVEIPKRLHFREEFRKYFSSGGAGIKVLARRWAEQLAKRSAG